MCLTRAATAPTDTLTVDDASDWHALGYSGGYAYVKEGGKCLCTMETPTAIGGFEGLRFAEENWATQCNAPCPDAAKFPNQCGGTAVTDLSIFKIERVPDGLSAASHLLSPVEKAETSSHAPRSYNPQGADCVGLLQEKKYVDFGTGEKRRSAIHDEYCPAVEDQRRSAPERSNYFLSSANYRAGFAHKYHVSREYQHLYARSKLSKARASSFNLARCNSSSNLPARSLCKADCSFSETSSAWSRSWYSAAEARRAWRSSVSWSCTRRRSPP
jgi:hypothetical protein